MSHSDIRWIQRFENYIAEFGKLQTRLMGFKEGSR